ncbi:MAG: hypothetical protein ACR2RD_04160 [Woeseiaceae bacterium]
MMDVVARLLQNADGLIEGFRPGVTQPAPAPRFSETASEISAPPPDTGQDTEVVLRAAGYSGADIRAMHEKRII